MVRGERVGILGALLNIKYLLFTSVAIFAAQHAQYGQYAQHGHPSPREHLPLESLFFSFLKASLVANR